MTRTFSRRRFLGGIAGAAASAALPFAALGRALGEEAAEGGGYGPLFPVRDRNTGLPLLELPRGFEYTTFGWAGDPLRGGSATPARHDGMAAFEGPEGTILLVRNHEIRGDTGPFAPGAPVYDPAGAGGTTSLVFDPRSGELREAWPSLTGTLTNCAGGSTPWGTWLTCEEDVSGPLPEGWGACDLPPYRSARPPVLEKPHGYVFEVPLQGRASGEPLRALGRFVHEAVAVDPDEGVVYLTEDNSPAGLYRFLPERRGRLAAGGRLEMLAVVDRPGLDLAQGQAADARHAIHWVPVPEPDPPVSAANAVFRQGFSRGGASFKRLEGAWWHSGMLYFSSTNGGAACQGQIWALEPRSHSLRLVLESTHAAQLNQPDNLTVSPRGGLVLAEDGEGTEYLHGIGRDGRLFRLLQNRVLLTGQRNDLWGDFTDSELAGPCFSPDGRWLFVNVQTPGITVAVTGPWESGPL